MNIAAISSVPSGFDFKTQFLLSSEIESRKTLFPLNESINQAGIIGDYLPPAKAVQSVQTPQELESVEELRSSILASMGKGQNIDTIV